MLWVFQNDFSPHFVDCEVILGLEAQAVVLLVGIVSLINAFEWVGWWLDLVRGRSTDAVCLPEFEASRMSSLVAVLSTGEMMGLSTMGLGGGVSSKTMSCGMSFLLCCDLEARRGFTRLTACLFKSLCGRKVVT
jgi:hypothetical protein